jgi:uncharacterized membrane protein YeiH
MAPEGFTTIVVADLVGIFVFAVSGGLLAVRKELDIFGVLVLAGVTGLGGGFIRDVLVGAPQPASLQDWRYLLVPAVGGLAVFYFHGAIGRAERVMNVFDALGLGLFVVAGAMKAIDYGLGPLPATIIGTITGIGGGIMRDLLAGRVPIVLHGGYLYATPATAGAAVAAFGLHGGLEPFLAGTAGAVLCIGWRLLAMWRRWQAPTAAPQQSASA